jgi:hypothetical protein
MAKNKDKAGKARIRVARTRATGWVVMSVAFTVGVSATLALAFTTKQPKDAPAASSSSTGDTVWVQKPDGGQQCEPGTGKTLDAGAEDLARAKITVKNSRKGSDGKLRIQLCGSPTGGQNAYEIPRKDLARAKSLGFEEVLLAE